VDIDRTSPGDDPRPIIGNGQGPESSERINEFIALFAQNQRKLFLFVMSMIPNKSDAEEVMQETSLLLWRDFGRFQPGTSFTAWSYRIALNQTLAWRKRRRRDRLEFSPELLEVIAEESIAEADRLEERVRALARCIAELPEQHQSLLRKRYGEGLEVEAIGRELGRSAEAVYRALSRIRHVLRDCVTRALAQENSR
jgi:RNA polymerase sigma-70 factor (ECF subfamily)